MLLVFWCEADGLLAGAIKVETGIDPEGRTIIQESAARAFGLGEDVVGLIEREIGKRRGQQITGFGRALPNVLGTADVLRVNSRQVVGLRGFVKGLVLCRIGKPAVVLMRAL